MNLEKVNEVTDILKSFFDDSVTLQAARLFFEVEDNVITIEDVEKQFGAEVSDIIKNTLAVNKLGFNANQTEHENIVKMLVALSKDVRSIFIKLSLALYRMRHLPNEETERQKRALRAANIYAPIAARLGIHDIKSELENRAFEILNPQEYENLSNMVELKLNTRAEKTKQTITSIKETLAEMKIDAIVSGRAKQYASIYKKIQKKSIDLNKIYDLIAIRVIVKTEEECYLVLGKIHSLFTPMANRFKDYIAAPKENGYKSLHSTVLLSDGTPIEIQIRTEEMHKFAEFGIAAHFLYKENKNSKDKIDDKLLWLRQLIELEEQLDKEDFAEALKTNLTDGEIFAQTPKGKVFNFSEGATVIDFAYAVHSEIGDKCVGSKINGKMVPIFTKLKNGDVVEILTKKNSKGPKRDWLKHCMTPNAQHKIRSFLRKEVDN